MIVVLVMESVRAGGAHDRESEGGDDGDALQHRPQQSSSQAVGIFGGEMFAKSSQDSVHQSEDKSSAVFRIQTMPAGHVDIDIVCFHSVSPFFTFGWNCGMAFVQ